MPSSKKGLGKLKTKVSKKGSSAKTGQSGIAQRSAKKRSSAAKGGLAERPSGKAHASSKPGSLKVSKTRRPAVKPASAKPRKKKIINIKADAKPAKKRKQATSDVSAKKAGKAKKTAIFKKKVSEGKSAGAKKASGARSGPAPAAASQPQAAILPTARMHPGHSIPLHHRKVPLDKAIDWEGRIVGIKHAESIEPVLAQRNKRLFYIIVIAAIILMVFNGLLFYNKFVLERQAFLDSECLDIVECWQLGQDNTANSYLLIGTLMVPGGTCYEGELDGSIGGCLPCSSAQRSMDWDRRCNQLLGQCEGLCWAEFPKG